MTLKREIINWEDRDRDDERKLAEETKTDNIENIKCRGRVFVADPEKMREFIDNIRKEMEERAIANGISIEEAPVSEKRRVA